MCHLLKSLLIGSAIAAPMMLATPAALAQDKIKAVASFSILGDFVARVGGDRVDVATIVGPDGDAHVYEPKPEDAKNVAAADVVFVNGLAFEGWLDRLVEASGYKGKVVAATAGIEPEKMAEEHGHEHAEGEKKAEHEHEHEHAEAEKKAESGHDHGEFDPHAWQSAANARTYVKNIAKALCEADTQGCDTYKANAEAYGKELTTLDEEIKAAMAKVPEERRTVITSHDAFGYFAHEYGIKFLAPEGISTESEASAKDVAKLIEQIREDKASALFVENVSDPRLIEQIGKETGLKVGGALYSDALSGKDGPASTYIDMMRHNAKLLGEAMAGS
jgi:zinc/manganese transport system substrate-binding protein